MSKGVSSLAPLLTVAALAFGQPELGALGEVGAGASTAEEIAGLTGSGVATGGALGTGATADAVGGVGANLAENAFNNPIAGNPDVGTPNAMEASDFGADNTGFGNLAASAFNPASAASANPFSTLANSVKSLPWNTISGGMNIGSGIYGMMQRKRMEDMAKTAFGNYQNMGDPYASVKALMANPSSVTGQPGYQFGLDQGRLAIQRQGAASGSGGNESIALARYTPEYAQNFYNNEVARQMGVAGGEANLGTASAGIGLNAQNASNSLASSALGSIGYGATQIGGGSPYDQLIQKMLAGMH